MWLLTKYLNVIECLIGRLGVVFGPLHDVPFMNNLHFIVDWPLLSTPGKINENQRNSNSEREKLLEELLQREGNRSSDLISAMLQLSFEGASVSWRLTSAIPRHDSWCILFLSLSPKQLSYWLWGLYWLWGVHCYRCPQIRKTNKRNM